MQGYRDSKQRRENLSMGKTQSERKRKTRYIENQKDRMIA